MISYADDFHPAGWKKPNLNASYSQSLMVHWTNQQHPTKSSSVLWWLVAFTRVPSFLVSSKTRERDGWSCCIFAFLTYNNYTSFVWEDIPLKNGHWTVLVAILVSESCMWQQLIPYNKQPELLLWTIPDSWHPNIIYSFLFLLVEKTYYIENTSCTTRPVRADV